MKILHIINNLGSGGAEKLIEETLPLLNNIEGIKADVLLLTDKNNVFEDTLIKKGTKVDVVKYGNVYNPRNIFAIKKYIENGNYDIVHSHLFPTQYWVGIASKMLGKKEIKFITTEHSNHNRRREKRYFRYIDTFIYKNYDYIISITEQVRTNLIKWLKIKENEIDKFVIINNGVSTKKYLNALPYVKSEIKSYFTEETKLITMVGRFSEAKDHGTVIKAMRELPDYTHLLLIGEGPLIDKNKSLAKELGVPDRVHFLGFRNDIEKILKTSDIIVLSSHWEGLSLASIEAMASGKPFIASRVQGLEDIVDGYGLLFEEENHKELSKMIVDLLNNETFHKEVVGKCLQRAEDFNIGKMIESMIFLYKK